MAKAAEQLPSGPSRAQRLMQAVAVATSFANKLPGQSSTGSSFSAHALHGLLSSLSSTNGPARPPTPPSDDEPDPFHLSRLALDTSEQALDAAAVLVDEATGVAAESRAAVARVLSRAKTSATVPRDRGRTLHELPKPQEKFYDYPLDNSDSPFVSRRARVQEGREADAERHMIELQRNNSVAVGTRARRWGVAGLSPHPYEEEIEAACSANVAELEDAVEIGELKGMEETPWEHVRDEEQLKRMVEHLRGEDAIAVDLEHHSERSFQGFTCLVQISSRTRDFLVDALPLREHLHKLNEMFLNPKTVKVLHGANSDVTWLERDFGVYLVNLFDTAKAARVLEYPSQSLSYLLSRFCDVPSDAKKIYQLSDWRIRPIPDDMAEYARQDTHFLLYVYDRLREELIQNGKMADCWKMSKNVALLRYEKERFDPNGHLRLPGVHNKFLPKAQERVLQELYRWRDKTAREEDESPEYVMSFRAMIRVSLGASKIKKPGDLLARCGTKGVSSLVRRDASKLAELIADAASVPDKTPRSSAAACVPKRPAHIRFVDDEAEPKSEDTPTRNAGETNTPIEKPISKPSIVSVVESKRSALLDAEDDTDEAPSYGPAARSSPDLMIGVEAQTSPRNVLVAVEASKSALYDSADEEPMSDPRIAAVAESLSRAAACMLNPIEHQSTVSKTFTEKTAPKSEGKETQNGNQDARQSELPPSESAPDPDVLPLSISEKFQRPARPGKADRPRKKRKREKVIEPFDFDNAPWPLNRESGQPAAEVFHPTNGIRPERERGKSRKVPHGNVKPKSGQRSMSYTFGGTR